MRSSRKVLVEVDDNISLIVGDPEGIVGPVTPALDFSSRV
jgi:hypothetical protein